MEKTGRHTAAAMPGRKSQFDVLLDGRLVFSKEQVGRHVEQHEILELLD